MGYAGPIGAEYKPRTGNTAGGLGWLEAFKKVLK
jgi:hydroxypyruvate isomerase